jgi:hypothetical protein
MAGGTAVDKSPQDGTGIGPQHAIAADGFGFESRLGEALFDQSQGLPCGPAVRRGVGQRTPPGLVRKAQPPVWLLRGQQIGARRT